MSGILAPDKFDQALAEHQAGFPSSVAASQRLREHDAALRVRLFDAEAAVARLAFCPPHSKGHDGSCWVCRAEFILGQRDAYLVRFRELKQILAAVILAAGPVRVPRTNLQELRIVVTETTSLITDEFIYTAAVEPETPEAPQ